MTDIIDIRRLFFSKIRSIQALPVTKGGINMNGLFLQGGGAKGAFEAGAVYAMHEKKLKFDIIAGTSIGAVNGYFIYTNNIEKMKEIYTETDFQNEIRDIEITDTISNDFMIEKLKELKGKNNHVKSFYINYVNVKDGKLKEIRIDVSKLTKEKALTCIKYSSLLPYVRPDGIKSMPFAKVAESFNSKDISDKFHEKVKEGKYDNFNIDGGILNNNFMEPFIQNHVKKLYLLVLHNNFEIPQYLLDNYERNNIILIQRKGLFKPNDSLNFDKKFLCELFKEGYDAAIDKCISN